MNVNAKVSVFRFDPSESNDPHFDTFEVPPQGWQGLKVIETLRYIYEHFDSGLSFREQCFQRLCGACAISVNKKSVMSCAVFSEKEMLIEPAPNKKIIKDLVVEL